MTSAVIVVAYLPHEFLSRCLASVVDACDDLILVDNGSADASVSKLGSRFECRTVRLDRNVGLPAGINVGLAATNADVIGLLNDDAFADPEWLASAADVLVEPGVAAVAPKLVFDRPFAEIRLPNTGRQVGDDPRRLGHQLFSVTVDGVQVLDGLQGPGVYPIEAGVADGTPRRWRWTRGDHPFYVPLRDDDYSEIAINGQVVAPTAVVDLINNAGCYLTDRGFGGDIGLGRVALTEHAAAADVFGASGAALVTTAEALSTIGTFAGHFFAYYEDIDWSWRAQLAGLRIRYEPKSRARHVGGATSGGPAAASVRALATRNRLRALARNAPLAVLRHEIQERRHTTASHTTRGDEARHIARELFVERPRLALRRRRSPREVWNQWAISPLTDPA